MPDAAPLSSDHCAKGRDASHRLDRDAIDALLQQVPGWSLADDGAALVRTFRFDDYYRTISFVNALAHVANREDHHPDLSVHYDRCEVRFSTHDADGLTRNDFICAAKAGQLAD